MDVQKVLAMAGVTPDSIALMFPGLFSALACAAQAQQLASSAMLLCNVSFDALKLAATHGKDVDPETVRKLREAAGFVAAAGDRLRRGAEQGFPFSLVLEEFKRAQEAGAGPIPGIPHTARS